MILRRFLFSFLLFISMVVYAQQQVPATNQGIANARPGDFIIRSNGQRVVLSQGDINYARRQLGLSTSPNTQNRSVQSNNSRSGSSSNISGFTWLIIIAGAIVLFFYIIPNIRDKIEWEERARQREIERQQYILYQQRERQKREEEKKQIIQNNLDWIKSVESSKKIYDNNKMYITNKDWDTFSDFYKFLKITRLNNIITPDKELMKPYLKCSVYEFSNGFRAIFRLKFTGLENEAILFYNEKLFDKEDLEQIKLYFEKNKLGNNTQKTGRSISLKLRDKILRRDNFKCVFCGRGANDGVKLHVDHIIPFSKGGTSHADNLQTLCDECNLGKSDRHNHSGNKKNSTTSPNMIDFYRNLLGLKLQFTHAELKTAYRESVAKYHPDGYGTSSSRDRKNAETLMKQINEAYEELKKIII